MLYYSFSIRVPTYSYLVRTTIEAYSWDDAIKSLEQLYPGYQIVSSSTDVEY